MSARQPFIPQHKPPLRVSVEDERNNSDSGDQQHASEPFKPNGLLSTVESPPSDQPAASRQSPSASQETPAASLPLNGINKPLNISSFAKSKFGPRRSFEDSSRVHSPRPNLGTPHPMRINPPAAFYSGASGFSSTPAFRLPQGVFHRQSPAASDDMSLNNAHIPTLNADIDDLSHLQPSRFVSSKSSLPRRVASRSSLEKIHEAPEEDACDSTNAGRPQDDRRIQENPVDEGDSRQYESMYLSSGRHKPPLRRIQKRITEDMDPDYNPNAKRQKLDQPENVQDAQQADEYQTDLLDTPPPPPPFTYPPLRTPSPPPYRHQIPEGERDASNKNALCALLGHDLDAYADTHKSAYEVAKKKWTECTMEEWTAGADEIGQKFTALIDLVKNHMTSKLKLYASLHATLQNQRNVLDKREEMLKHAREGLVRDGANVVAGKSGAIAPGKGKENAED